MDFFCQLQKLIAENEDFRFCELENDKKNVNSQFLQAFKKLKNYGDNFSQAKKLSLKKLKDTYSSLFFASFKKRKKHEFSFFANLNKFKEEEFNFCCELKKVKKHGFFLFCKLQKPRKDEFSFWQA